MMRVLRRWPKRWVLVVESLYIQNSHTLKKRRGAIILLAGRQGPLKFIAQGVDFLVEHALVGRAQNHAVHPDKGQVELVDVGPFGQRAKLHIELHRLLLDRRATHKVEEKIDEKRQNEHKKRDQRQNKGHAAALKAQPLRVDLDGLVAKRGEEALDVGAQGLLRGDAVDLELAHKDRFGGV